MTDKQCHFILEPEGISYIEKYNIPYPEYTMAQSPEEAAASADRLGYPVVLKIVSPDVLHKSDIGGVAVGLSSPEEVSRVYEEIALRVNQAVGGARIKGVLVCRQADEGLEVIVGAHQDEVFGPTIMFGLGGIFTEVFKDVTFRIAPLRKIDAQEMIREIKHFALLTGIRGQAARDLNALIDLIMAVSRLVTNEPNIKELDLNPVRLYAHGLLALDVRIIRQV